MSRYMVALLFLLTGLLPAGANVDETAMEQARGEAGERDFAWMKEEAKRRDVAIAFYGRVLDQQGGPVEDVDVVLQITQFTPDPEELFSRAKAVPARTDAHGKFVVSRGKGRSLYVKDMQRAGYEFSLEENPDRGYQYSGPSRLFVPDKDNPVVFHMRKKGATTFLLEQKYLDFQVLPARSGDTIGYDFVHRREIRTGAKPIDLATQLVCDLAVKATFSANDDFWTVTLSPATTNGGIILSDQVLYEAPESGYQPECTFALDPHKSVTGKHIYLRGRDPAIYTRIDVGRIVGDRRGFSLDGKSITNPYGDRNLEQATDLPYAVEEQLTAEAKAAFSHDRRPVKPDLPKMLKEAKEKAEKIGAKQGAAGGQP